MTGFSVDSLKALAFDVDGTLFSSEGMILEVYRDSIQNFSKTFEIQVDLPSRDQLMMEIGKPVKTIFRNLLPQLNEEQRDSISDSVLRFYARESKKERENSTPRSKKQSNPL